MYRMFIPSYLIILLGLQLAIASDTEMLREQYFVNSATCKMPNVNPFTKDVLSRMKQRKFVHCRENKDLVTSEYDFDLKQYHLNINEKVAQSFLGVKQNTTLMCRYQRITRNNEAPRPDETVRTWFSRPLSGKDLLPKSTDYLNTLCFVRNGTENKVVQVDAMAFVQDRESSEELKDQDQKKAADKQKDEKPNLIILGLDSMSRINFRRTMRRSYMYVKQPGWHELQGINPVGENTFPNLIALLTGLSKQDIKKICDIRESGCLDRLPFIWQRFKQTNYTTAYAEDCMDISSFNYMKPGFVKQPVDFYLRPLIVAMEQVFRLRLYLGNVYCVGRHLSFGYVWDFAQQFIQRFMRKGKPMFGLFWSNSFTHDVFDASNTLDDLFAEYFVQFERYGLFNRSIVILMSDHGMRFKTLRRLSSGHMEERSPMSFIYVPPWFRSKYPQLVANLKTNRNRLSSIYDLHMTLQHLIQLNSTSRADFQLKANSCQTCQSLFLELPINRTCSQAAIPEFLCACNPFQTVTEAPYAQKLAEAVVQRLNENLLQNNLTELCMNFTLKEVINLDLKMKVDSSLNTTIEHSYILKFKTLPNSPIFQSTFIWNNRTNQLKIDIPKIIRLNSYKSDAKCIRNKKFHKYCICKSSVENSERNFRTKTIINRYTVNITKISQVN